MVALHVLNGRVGWPDLDVILVRKAEQVTKGGAMLAAMGPCKTYILGGKVITKRCTT